MRTKRDHGNGNDGQHVDRSDSINHRSAQNEAHYTEYDPEKYQDSGERQNEVSQRPSPGAVQKDRQ
jgi:hypothetical protein